MPVRSRSCFALIIASPIGVPPLGVICPTAASAAARSGGPSGRTFLQCGCRPGTELVDADTDRSIGIPGRILLKLPDQVCNGAAGHGDLADRKPSAPIT